MIKQTKLPVNLSFTIATRSKGTANSFTLDDILKDKSDIVHAMAYYQRVLQGREGIRLGQVDLFVHDGTKEILLLSTLLTESTLTPVIA